LLYELGFRNPRRRDPDRWSGTRLDIFLRWRGVDYDEIRIYWWTVNRPRFRIDLMASTYERDAEGCPTEFRWVTQAGANSWVLKRAGRPWMMGDFGPWSSPRATAEMAARRLREANDFLLTGEMGPHIAGRRIRLGPGLDPPEIPLWWRRFGDPALDPESDVARPGEEVN
jgi:hypothetical protein